MSLSSINASIEDVRRRVAEVRSKLELIDEKILSLVRLSIEIKEVKDAYCAKLVETEAARHEHEEESHMSTSPFPSYELSYSAQETYPHSPKPASSLSTPPSPNTFENITPLSFD